MYPSCREMGAWVCGYGWVEVSNVAREKEKRNYLFVFLVRRKRVLEPLEWERRDGAAFTSFSMALPYVCMQVFPCVAAALLVEKKEEKNKKGRKIHWQLNYASAFRNALKNCLSKRVLFKHNSLSVTVVFFPGRKPFSVLFGSQYSSKGWKVAIDATTRLSFKLKSMAIAQDSSIFNR